ncbi:fungal-specific transcription factor domain-containing protein [Fusarium oxysporum f. sp. albedinis]|nr:fungal-specific transcription factor domain-containing protein [Fusarium oxysporum f. sp. albedinis]
MSRSQTGQDMAARTENETAPPRKRQKIGLACEECRSRKVRCDGLRPECSACKRREKVCIYLTESSKLSGSRRALHSLHDRVACLEAKAKGETAPRRLSENLTSGTGLDERLPLKQSSHAVNADLSPPQSQQCDTDSIVVEPHQTLSHPQPHPCAVSSISGTSKDAARDVDSLSSNQDMGALSAMGIALLATEATNDATREFYGEPSAASLLCDIEDHRQQRPSRPQPHCQDSAPQPSPPSSRRSFSVPYPSNPDDYHLPPRHMADSLLDIYRERVQIIYPFLHWQTFMEAYHRLWLSNSEVKSMPQLTGVGLGGPRCPVPVFYCALNAAFALATQFTDGSAQERKERSAPFVRRSRHLMRLDFLDATDISMVQALLILARYLQSTSLPTRCWNVAGIAYRMAQGLGLHITVDERSPSKLDIEMRRRVWHSCACLETALGMLTGRPGSNSTTSKVPLPNISDQDISTYTPVGSDHSDNDVPTATFFAQAIKLNHILNRILSHIYDPWKEHAASMQIELDDVKQYAEQVSSTISFDHELNRFETRLPEALRWSTDKSKLHGGNDLAQQRHVLRSRFLHIRLLLYRPLFVQLCQRMNAQAKTCSGEKPGDFSRTPSQLYDAFAEKCSTTCIEIAQALIDHIDNASKITYTGSPWYSCYYVYHAAIVVILADGHCSGLHQVNHSNLHESWRACDNFFSRMSEHNPDMYRYFRRLESLSRFAEPTCASRSLTPGCLGSKRESNVAPKAPGATNDTPEADAQTFEEIIMRHNTDSHPYPAMLLGDGDAWFAPSAQFSDMEFEPALYDDQLWTIAGLSAMNADGMIL